MSGPLRLAIIGCGGYSGAHLRRLCARPAVQVVALCSRREESIIALEGRRLPAGYPPPRRFTDPATMFAEMALDGVVIATPHADHHGRGLQALHAGCHVLMEKPLAIGAEAAGELCTLAAEQGLHLQVAFEPLATPALRWVRRVLTDGRFGPVRAVQAFLCQDWQRPTAGSWRQDPGLGGEWGQIGDSGAHLLAALCWLFGDPVLPVTVQAAERGCPVLVDGALLWSFAEGISASATIIGSSASEGSHCAIVCRDGLIECDAWRGSWVRARLGGEVLDIPADDGGPASPDDQFVDLLLGRVAADGSKHAGLAVARLLDAVQQGALQQTFRG